MSTPIRQGPATTVRLGKDHDRFVSNARAAGLSQREYIVELMDAGEWRSERPPVGATVLKGHKRRDGSMLVNGSLEVDQYDHDEWTARDRWAPLPREPGREG